MSNENEKKVEAFDRSLDWFVCTDCENWVPRKETAENCDECGSNSWRSRETETSVRLKSLVAMFRNPIRSEIPPNSFTDDVERAVEICEELGELKQALIQGERGFIRADVLEGCLKSYHEGLIDDDEVANRIDILIREAGAPDALDAETESRARGVVERMEAVEGQVTQLFSQLRKITEGTPARDAIERIQRMRESVGDSDTVARDGTEITKVTCPTCDYTFEGRDLAYARGMKYLPYCCKACVDQSNS